MNIGKTVVAFVHYVLYMVAAFALVNYRERRDLENTLLANLRKFFRKPGALESIAEVLTRVPKRLLVHLFEEDSAVVRSASVLEFDRRSLDEDAGEYDTWSAYSVALRHGTASARTLRPYLKRLNHRGFFNTQDAKVAARSLSANRLTANHLVAALRDEDRDVVAGALHCLRTVLDALLRGRLAQTGEGFRFYGYETLAERAARVQFERDYNRLDLDASVEYDYWRSLVLAEADYILSIADLRTNSHSLNNHVMLLFEALACDADSVVAQTLLQMWPQFRKHAWAANLHSINGSRMRSYHCGISGLRSRFQQFRVQLADQTNKLAA